MSPGIFVDPTGMVAGVRHYLENMMTTFGALMVPASIFLILYVVFRIARISGR